MRFGNLDSWLTWQETLNPKEIDLGLDRILQVLQNAGLSQQFDCPLITVAGTNGKGSVVSYLESMATAAGYKVCSYTSPHLQHYNERIRINGSEIDDDSLCQSFERIDQARKDLQLTYFEFGTLAAIDLCKRAQPDLVIMEVGLGGRLDAVNVMEPDVSVITSIALDHTDWLGDTREAIAYEKAGIMRAGKPVICGDLEPPEVLSKKAVEMGAKFQLINRDYHVGHMRDRWHLQTTRETINDLPLPALSGDFQLNNAATAIVALQALSPDLNVAVSAISHGLTHVKLQGRYQTLCTQPRVIADVAHNPQAVAALVEQLQADLAAGKTHVVIAMLADKPVAEVIKLLQPITDYWYCAGLESVSRGLSSHDMASFLEHMSADVKLCAESSVAEACALAMQKADRQDRIIIMGSFYTVAEAICFFTDAAVSGG